MLKRQRGVSLILWLALLALVIAIGLRLAPIYIGAFTVKSIVREVARESPNVDRSPAEIWSSIERRLAINNVKSIKRENFTYERDNGAVMIGITYEARSPLIGNLDGIARFDITEPLAQGSGQ